MTLTSTLGRAATLSSTLASTLTSTLASTLTSTLASTLTSTLASTLHSTLASTLTSTLGPTLAAPSPSSRPHLSHLCSLVNASTTSMPTMCACGCKERVSHNGCFRKGHQPAGETRDPDGKIKALNDIWSPITNPITNAKWNPINGPITKAKKQERARLEAVERIATFNHFETQLTLDGAAVVATKIMETFHGPTFNAMTIEEHLNINGPSKMPFYIGYTAQRLKDEALRFLTERGLCKETEPGIYIDVGKRNRPVFLWSDGTTITGTDAQIKVGFRFFEVYSSTLMINARNVEKALQLRYQHLPLGHRLWRCADMGKKYDKEVDGKMHKVFVTYSPDAEQMLAESKIKINY